MEVENIQPKPIPTDLFSKVEEVPKVSPKGIQPDDPFSPYSTKRSKVPFLSKPELPMPMDVPEWKLLEVMERLYGTGTEMMETQFETLDHLHERLREISTENIAKMKEAAEHAQTSGFWGMLKDIASYVLSAISTVFGISLVATGAGAIVGGALIAAGILSIANLAFSQSGVWDWVADKLAGENKELKRLLKVLLPAAVGMVCAAISTLGTAGALLFAQMDLAQKISLVLNSIANLMTGVSTIGRGASEYNRLNTESLLNAIRGKLFSNEHLIEDESSDLQEWMKTMTSATKEAAAMIRKSTYAFKLSTQV